MTPGPVALNAETDTSSLFAALIAAMNAGNSLVGVYDEHDNLRFANDSFLRTFGLVAGQSVTFADIVLHAAQSGKTVRIDATDAAAFIADAQSRRRAVVSEPRQRSFAVDFVDDVWFWCTETLLPNGWIVLTGSDITSLKHAERRLSTERDEALLLSGTDELTGAPNRRFILAHLDALLNARAIGAGPVSVALLDLDHFKSINDTFGHETGDIALRHFARHCMSHLPGQHVGRLGGEEFVVLFPAATSDAAKAILDQLLLSIPPVSSRLPARVSINLSYSAGVAQAQDGESRANLLSRADRALYSAKVNGRSRIEIDVAPAEARRSAP